MERRMYLHAGTQNIVYKSIQPWREERTYMQVTQNIVCMSIQPWREERTYTQVIYVHSTIQTHSDFHYDLPCYSKSE